MHPGCRTNVAYELNNGRVYIFALVQDPTQPATLTVSVSAGVGSTPEGLLNAAADFSLQYRPRQTGLDYLSLGIGTLMTAVITGSASANIMATLLAPLPVTGQPACTATHLRCLQ